MAKNHYIIPFFVPHLGCPHDCIFCNQRSITGLGQAGFPQAGTGEVDLKQAQGPEQTLEQDLAVTHKISQYLATIPQDPARPGWPAPEIRVEAAFYGGSFTGIPLEQQRELLEPAYHALQQGYIQGIRISTRPDYISEEILEFLQQYGVSAIELGIQSLDQEVLTKANRGHTREAALKAAKTIKAYGKFNLGLQMMVGLPGDSPAKALATAIELSALKPDFVRIYPALVIQDTVLENLFRTKQYQPLELQEAVQICAQVLKVFNEAKIPVIRIGLQPTEEIRAGSQVVAGPFHPAFRELVEGELAKECMEELLAELTEQQQPEQPQPKQLQPGAEVTLAVAPRDISIVLGQHKKNIKYLEEKYKLKLKIVQEPALARGDIRLVQYPLN